MDLILSPVDVLLNIPRWCYGSMLGFLTYYLLQVVKQPDLVCSRTFKKFLRANVPVLQEKYWPTLWCFESRIQTALANFLRSVRPIVKYRREILKLSDGGHIALDWLEDGCSEDAPIIIVLPGLTGQSQSEYVRCLVRAANRANLRTVVFNYRGLGGMSLKTPRTYNAANYEDLSEIVNYVKSLHPTVPLAAAGISMGSLILGNYLVSQHGQSKKTLVGAMGISPPWNCFKAIDSLEKPILNMILNRYLATGFSKYRSRHESMLEGPWDMEEIMKCKTVREFDSSYTAKQFGYENVEAYYADASLHEKLHKIEIPMLCLSARDDPVQPYEAIPVEEARKSSHVAIVITARGGHIGFLEGIFPLYNEEEYICRMFTQYFTAIFDSGSELAVAIGKNK